MDYKYAVWEERDYTKKLDDAGEIYRVPIPSFICSNCKCVEKKRSNFCPNCGSIMVEGMTSDGCAIYYAIDTEDAINGSL